MLTLIGIVAALFGWAPRIAGAVGWFFVGYSIVLMSFGAMLSLPDWLNWFNPFSHMANYPVEDIAWAPFLWLSIIGLAGIVLGLLG